MFFCFCYCQCLLKINHSTLSPTLKSRALTRVPGNEKNWSSWPRCFIGPWTSYPRLSLMYLVSVVQTALGQSWGVSYYRGMCL